MNPFLTLAVSATILVSAAAPAVDAVVVSAAVPAVAAAASLLQVLDLTSRTVPSKNKVSIVTVKLIKNIFPCGGAILTASFFIVHPPLPHQEQIYRE